MNIDAIMIIIFALIIIPVIWVTWLLYKSDIKTDTENWDRVINAPEFRVVPSYDLGYAIEKKELWPMWKRCPMMVYRPLSGHYKTKEEAEIQIEHYASGGGAK